MAIKTKRIFALLLALVLTFALTACRDNGGNGDESTTDAGGVTDAQQADITVVSSSDESTTSAEDTTEKSAQSSASGSSQSAQSSDQTTFGSNGLNSTNIKTVVEFYKAAAKKTDKIDAKQTMTLARIDFTPQNTFQKGLLSAFKGIATAALKANSTPRTDVPGNHQALKTSDLNSANAIVSGDYTIVTLNVKSQEDNQDTKDWGQGPVGHAVGTLGDITKALEAIPAVEVDYSQGSIVLRYDNCKVVVKINNKTGKIEAGTWSYTVNITLTDIYASFGGSNHLKLTNMGGAVDFAVKTRNS